jgi:hypothetical protein
MQVRYKLRGKDTYASKVVSISLARGEDGVLLTLIDSNNVTVQHQPDGPIEVVEEN